MNQRDAHNRAVTRLGVVSFLNARPLIEGLRGRPDLALHEAVPARLGGMLAEGLLDAALVPVIDLARSRGRWTRVSDVCIGSDGPTLTVRVFARVPPERIEVLHADTDSHTSVVLARLIWRHVYGRSPVVVPLDGRKPSDDREAVLLIGDKVVTSDMTGFPHELDLGEAWKRWTGLPFVFAVWAAPAGVEPSGLAEILERARDRGVARAAAIAWEQGPARGWPAGLAEEYLVRRLIYRLTPAALAGLERYTALAGEAGWIETPSSTVS